MENVWASKTSLTDTAINSPRNVDVKAIKRILPTSDPPATPEKSAMKEATSKGKNAFNTPNSQAVRLQRV